MEEAERRRKQTFHNPRPLPYVHTHIYLQLFMEKIQFLAFPKH